MNSNININIITAKTAGFCFGVKRAVNEAEKLAEAGGGYTLGQLIHNPFVIKKLQIFTMPQQKHVPKRTKYPHNGQKRRRYSRSGALF